MNVKHYTVSYAIVFYLSYFQVLPAHPLPSLVSSSSLPPPLLHSPQP